MSAGVLPARSSLVERGRLDGAFEQGAGDVGVGDRGGGAEVEHRRQVQRIGPDDEGLLQNAVAADLLVLNTAQQQVMS